MCKVLGISKSGYYSRRNNGIGEREKQRDLLVKEIKVIYLESRGLYGSPRITAELKRRGISCTRKRVAQLMQRAGIRSKKVGYI